MRVTVKHFAQLKQTGEQRTKHLELMEDASVDDLLPTLGLKQEDVGILIVNGKEAIWGQKLKEDDAVTIIPHIGGG